LKAGQDKPAIYSIESNRRAKSNLLTQFKRKSPLEAGFSMGTDGAARSRQFFSVIRTRDDQKTHEQRPEEHAD